MIGQKISSRMIWGSFFISGERKYFNLSIYLHLYILEGAGYVMVIVERNGHDEPSSNPG